MLEAKLLEKNGKVFELMHFAEFPECIITHELGSSEGPERFRAWIRQTDTMGYAELDKTLGWCDYLEAGTTCLVTCMSRKSRFER